MRNRKLKKIYMVLMIATSALLMLAVGGNMITKAAIQSIGSAKIGSRLTVGKLDIGFLSSKITMDDLKLHNSRGSKDPIMADIAKLYVHYKASTFFSGNPSLRELRIDLRELLVVKNENGELNVKSLNPLPKMAIDLLRLKIEKVVYKDYSGGDLNPTAREFNINFEESYQNVSDINSIAPLIASKALSEMKQLILGKIGTAGQEAVSGAANKAADVVEKVADTAAQGIKNILQPKSR